MISLLLYMQVIGDETLAGFRKREDDDGESSPSSSGPSYSRPTTASRAAGGGSGRASPSPARGASPSPREVYTPRKTRWAGGPRRSRGCVDAKHCEGVGTPGRLPAAKGGAGFCALQNNTRADTCAPLFLPNRRPGTSTAGGRMNGSADGSLQSRARAGAASGRATPDVLTIQHSSESGAGDGRGGEGPEAGAQTDGGDWAAAGGTGTSGGGVGKIRRKGERSWAPSHTRAPCARSACLRMPLAVAGRCGVAQADLCPTAAAALT